MHGRSMSMSGKVKITSLGLASGYLHGTQEAPFSILRQIKQDNRIELNHNKLKTLNAQRKKEGKVCIRIILNCSLTNFVALNGLGLGLGLALLWGSDR